MKEYYLKNLVSHILNKFAGSFNSDKEKEDMFPL